MFNRKQFSNLSLIDELNNHPKAKGILTQDNFSSAYLVLEVESKAVYPITSGEKQALNELVAQKEVCPIMIYDINRQKSCTAAQQRLMHWLFTDEKDNLNEPAPASLEELHNIMTTMGGGFIFERHERRRLQVREAEGMDRGAAPGLSGNCAGFFCCVNESTTTCCAVQAAICCFFMTASG